MERRLEPDVVAAGQERVERGLLERCADRLAYLRAVLDDVEAADDGAASVGGSSVVSMWTVVDFPAPFGPRNP